MTNVTANAIKTVGAAIQQKYDRNGDAVKSRYSHIRAKSHEPLIKSTISELIFVEQFTTRTQFDALINTNRKKCHTNSKQT